jgi:hypothetical protein
MVTSSKFCELCSRQQLQGNRYNFWYGKKSPESRHYEGAMRVRTRYYTFAGTQSAWICERCVRPYKLLRGIFLALMPTLLVLSPFLPMWDDIGSKICFGGIGLSLIVYLIWFFINYPNDTGEKMAIRLHKKKLKAGGYNIFLTAYEYNSLKKQFS